VFLIILFYTKFVIVATHEPIEGRTGTPEMGSQLPCTIVFSDDTRPAREVQHDMGLVHFPIPTQNIFSFTHHIKSFDAYMEH
jgi:hypothetical protein